MSYSNRTYKLPSFRSRRSGLIDEDDIDVRINVPEAVPMSPLNLTSADTMLKDGVEKFDDKFAAIIEKSLGERIPGMEIHFQDLTISADVTLDDSGSAEMPTVWNSLKGSLSSCLKNKKTEQRNILKGINGIFKPGTITLVLGQPGSGKSALMKILSGRFPLTKTTTFDGSIRYNGMNRAEFLDRLPQFVSYVDQHDEHIPTLTVKETFQFAHDCMMGKEVPDWVHTKLSQGTEEDYAKATETVTAVHKANTDLIIRHFGLTNCQDTVVGDALLRGISGGEKKRVTSGEMSLSISPAMLMDEISTGLDSAATYDIVKSLRSLAKILKRTIVISLLQPPPEVYELFDEVLLLGEGDTMYHGPREGVIPHFESLGYQCPPRRDIADFLLDLGTERAKEYQTIVPSSGRIAYTIRDYVDEFKRSKIYDETISRLNTPLSSQIVQRHEELVKMRPAFRNSFWESTIFVLKRQIQITLRNTAFLRGRAFMVLLMGILYGTTFLDSDPVNAQVIIGVIFASVMFISLGQAAQIPTYMSARAVFYKQRGANFFRTSSYVISTTLTLLPFAILETLVFGSLVYWLAGLASGVKEFIIYEVILLLTNLMIASFFFFLCAASPSIHIAQPLANVFILVFVVFAGFVVTKDTIPNYFIWLYWINPMAWSIRALSVNQYQFNDFQVCTYGDIDYCALFGEKFGNYALSLFDIPSSETWIINGIIYLVASYVGFALIASFILENKRYESPENVSVTHEEIHEGYEEMPMTPKDSRNLSVHENVLEIETAIPFVPITLAFVDLWYSVPMPDNPQEEIDLLKGVSGFALPGTMTALMGSSGAGKTTLMDVIAGRKTGGRIQGDILFNGYPVNDLAVRRCTGYCEQMDIHSEASTIREALTFSAFLRLPADISSKQKYESVQECLDLLELNDIADTIIRGMSTEQMKRLTIGVELAAQPSVLFLDEPTSGLDARSAKIIMNGVRKIADSGRTIVCTIHQPSTEVFHLFDSLLLLKRGGECVFFGELGNESSELIDYFTKMPNTPPIPAGYNPATWMLEVIGAGVGHASTTNYAEEFKKSDLRAMMLEDLDQTGVSKPSRSIPELKFEKKRASKGSTQLYYLLQRFGKLYWRTPTYNLTRFILQIILALLFGLIYIDNDYTTFSGINSGVGMVFLSTVFLGIVAFNSALPIVYDERTVYYRERASQTYNALYYFIGFGLAEIPYVFTSVLLFNSVYYPMVGFTGYINFFWYWLNLSCFVFFEVYLGQLMIFALPNVEVASVLGTLINSIFILFMGFNPPESQIPSGYKWLYYISVPRYPLSTLAASVFSQCSDGDELGCEILKEAPPTFQNTTVKEYVEGNFNMNDDDQVINFVVLLGVIVIVRILGLIALRYVNHQKR